jgi:hypothetical protein
LSARRSAAALGSALALLAGAAPAGGQTIEARPLRGLTAWEVGALGAGPDAPAERWRASSPEGLTAAFEALPDVLISPAAWRLAERMLAAPSAPLENGDYARPLAERYEAMGRLGMAAHIPAMVRAAGDRAQQPGLLAFAAKAELANSLADPACQLPRLAQQPTPDLLLLRAYCTALARQLGPMDVAIDLARSAGARDPFLYTVLPVLAGVSQAKPAGRFDTALNAAASLQAGLKAPAAPLKDASSLALLAVARSDAAPIDLRYEAIERALIRGALETAPAQAGLLAILKALPAKRRATPWLVERLASVNALEGAARTGKIAELYAAEPLISRRAALARLFRSDIAGAPRGGERPPAAAALAEAALLLGDPRAARAWRAIAWPGLEPARAARLNLLLAAAGSTELEPAARARRAAAAGVAPAQLGREIALLGALGALSADLQTFAAQQTLSGQRADEQQLALLVEAAQRGAVGETGVRAAALLAPGANNLHPASLTSIIQALRQVGLEADARAAAVEGLL